MRAQRQQPMEAIFGDSIFGLQRTGQRLGLTQVPEPLLLISVLDRCSWALFWGTLLELSMNPELRQTIDKVISSNKVGLNPVARYCCFDISHISAVSADRAIYEGKPPVPPVWLQQLGCADSQFISRLAEVLALSF